MSKEHPGEEVILKVNPSRWNYWQYYAVALGGAVIFPPALLAIPFLEYYRKTTEYTVTSERIIKKKSFLDKKVDAITHDAVINVHVGQSPYHRLVNIGTVRIGTDSNDLQHLSLHGVPNPERVGSMIQKALREFHDKRNGNRLVLNQETQAEKDQSSKKTERK